MHQHHARSPPQAPTVTPPRSAPELRAGSPEVAQEPSPPGARPLTVPALACGRDLRLLLTHRIRRDGCHFSGGYGQTATSLPPSPGPHACLLHGSKQPRRPPRHGGPRGREPASRVRGPKDPRTCLRPQGWPGKRALPAPTRSGASLADPLPAAGGRPRLRDTSQARLPTRGRHRVAHGGSLRPQVLEKPFTPRQRSTTACHREFPLLLRGSPPLPWGGGSFAVHTFEAAFGDCSCSVYNAALKPPL